MSATVPEMWRAHERLGIADPVLGMHHADELGAERYRRRALVSEETHPAIAGGELGFLRVEVELGEVAAVERELQALLRVEERALRAALLGDVATDAAMAEEHRHRRAAREPDDAVLGVGLPEPVRGELRERAEAHRFGLRGAQPTLALPAPEVHG